MILTSAYNTNAVKEKRFSRDVLMNNELSRYGSFATFPLDSLAMPSRLAQAGFYYTGSGEEAVCFCCGLKNSSWIEGENVKDVHRRLSPHCRFVSGGETGNFAIHKDFTIKPSSSKGSSLGNKYKTVQYESDSKQSCDEHHDIENEKRGIDTIVQDSQTYENNDSVCEKPTCYGHISSNKSLVTRSHVNHRHEIQATTQCSYIINGQIELYPGITDKTPVHPDYALRSARLASFKEWPAHDVMDPSILAAAGFYYAGMQDCVRCFFCSCGMKNWEKGDKPWVEHARWSSPECAYVKLCRGNTFVSVCRSATNLDIKEEITKENIPDDWLIENINSVAAKLVLGKGYSQSDVEKGLLMTRQKYGSGEIKTQFIMEHLHDANVKPCLNEMAITDDNKMLYQTQSDFEGSKNDVHSNTAKPTPKTVGMSESLSRSSDGHSGVKSEKQRLLEENRRLKDLITCKICMDNDACVAFLPCGHMTSCVECSKNLKKCAICRTLVQGTVRVYQA